ncbi:hypothetical protein U0C82_15820 [Fulvimarina sp. 2208YS6-2-32]|uniref:ABM domain-containing protein n=1 Tax=Fulvimarina uroteuthidis TaxID=3098149 RepID=A0ABU5I5E2_9HYPH|nr:hypothetical protein [Fulvimarina sp. 2208YS6-2-32]MDY8110610.1 hypothetical protein [Fulvimarina sp. 2208YS6-2-32]
MAGGVPVSLYAPRPVCCLGTRQISGFAVKVYVILGPGRHRDDEIVDAALVAASPLLGASQQPNACQELGFVILHLGEHADWLLVDRWVHGDSLKNTLLKSERGRPHAFLPVPDPDLFACVWEAGIVDFERRAFIQTMMTTAPDESRYLSTILNGEV